MNSLWAESGTTVDTTPKDKMYKDFNSSTVIFQHARRKLEVVIYMLVYQHLEG